MTENQQYIVSLQDPATMLMSVVSERVAIAMRNNIITSQEMAQRFAEFDYCDILREMCKAFFKSTATDFSHINHRLMVFGFTAHEAKYIFHYVSVRVNELITSAIPDIAARNLFLCTWDLVNLDDLFITYMPQS